MRARVDVAVLADAATPLAAVLKREKAALAVP
jgi:hypothetical protein